MGNYEENQIEKLHGEVVVKFKSDNGETHWLNLTRDTCLAIATMITKLHGTKQIHVRK